MSLPDSRKGFCMYCGKVFEMKDDSESSVKSCYEETISHDAVCDKNPLVNKISVLVETLKMVYDAIPDCEGGKLGHACMVIRKVLSESRRNP